MEWTGMEGRRVRGEVRRKCKKEGTLDTQAVAHLFACPTELEESAARFVCDAAQLVSGGIEHAHLHDVGTRRVENNRNWTSVASARDPTSFPFIPNIRSSTFIEGASKFVPRFYHVFFVHRICRRCTYASFSVTCSAKTSVSKQLRAAPFGE